jgi:hypothetical protein
MIHLPRAKSFAVFETTVVPSSEELRGSIEACDFFSHKRSKTLFPLSLLQCTILSIIIALSIADCT